MERPFLAAETRENDEEERVPGEMLSLKKIIHVAGAVFALTTVLAACGGGGGGSTPGPVSTGGSGATATPTAGATSPSPSPSPTPTLVAATNSVSGTLVNRAAGTPISGATVTVGALPNAASCIAAQTNTTNVCGNVGTTFGSTTTSATGTFSITGLPTGTQMLVIGDGTAFATLHRTVPVAAGANALGTLGITALTSDQQAWVSDLNTQRTTVSSPVSYGNFVIDEYAVEEEAAMVAAVVGGTATFGPSAEDTYDALYGQQPGAMYLASNASGMSGTSGAYVSVDQGWMAGMSGCPNGDWQTCTYTSTTGQYINISNTDDVWIGPAESTTSYLPSGGTSNAWVYGVMVIQDASGSGLAGIRRAAAATPRRRS